MGKGLLMPVKEASEKLGLSRVSGFPIQNFLSQVSWSYSFPIRAPTLIKKNVKGTQLFSLEVLQRPANNQTLSLIFSSVCLMAVGDKGLL